MFFYITYMHTLLAPAIYTNYNTPSLGCITNQKLFATDSHPCKAVTSHSATLVSFFVTQPTFGGSNLRTGTQCYSHMVLLLQSATLTRHQIVYRMLSGLITTYKLFTGFYLALSLHTNNCSIIHHEHKLKTPQSSSRNTRKS